MERIQYLADLSIRRACGFGLLAIATGTVGLAWDAALALKAAAVGLSLMVAILIYKAQEAPTRSYKRTEVWLMLNKRHNLPEARIQQVFGNILHDRYMWHATAMAAAATFLWLVYFALQILKRAPAA